MSITFTKKGIRATGKGAQALFDAISARLDKPETTDTYVILVAPEVPCSYLAYEDDEDDGEPEIGPPRTSEFGFARTFNSLISAQAALQAALVRYPTHQFLIQKVTP